MAGHLAACLSPLYALGTTKVTVTPSIGISACPVDTCDAEVLMRYADTAMYHAKADGRDTFRFYEPDMNVWAAERRAFDAALRIAVRDREFALVYQPLVRLEDRRIVGVEALLRWERPGHGTILPCEFVPLLEETGLIVEAGAWVIDAACAQLRAWRERDGLVDLSLSLNVSGRQLALARRAHDARIDGPGSDSPADAFAATLRESIARHAIPPDRVHIEITESTLMEDAQQSARVLHELADLGIRIHVDDFGTGYSSLAYLKRFPIDSLKIDREFVRGLPLDVEDRAITEAILGLGRSLRLGVVAEGIEDEAQVAFLLEAGCAIGQGFVFSHPLAGDEVVARVRASMA
jgi:EAL domain-containing protein (putative c-di-GMP-specific phosphodiesterase class I)